MEHHENDFLRLKSKVHTGRVLFSAFGQNGVNFGSNTVITFEKLFADSGEGRNFNLSTGELKIPISGIYEFSFYAARCVSGTYVYIQKNGNLDFNLYNSDSDYDSISANWQMQLEKDDKVSLKVTSGRVYSSTYTRLFSGKLLE